MYKARRDFCISYRALITCLRPDLLLYVHIFCLALCLGEGYTQVYLPFYSDMAKDRRQRVRDGTLVNGRPAGPGSMWDNIDEAAKAKRGAGAIDERK